MSALGILPLSRSGHPEALRLPPRHREGLVASYLSARLSEPVCIPFQNSSEQYRALI